MIERLAYTDTWERGIDSYLDMLYIRFKLMRRLLSPEGSIYVHSDTTMSHYIKVLLDEVFGHKNFRNEIIWKRTFAHGSADRWGDVHDTIFFYSKTDKYTWTRLTEPHEEAYLSDNYVLTPRV
jgi:adenine-specific DNA-methyltransferase